MTAATDLLYSDTERALASALADLLSERASSADVLARTEQPETYDAGLWRTVAADVGVAGLLIPEPLGGAGASYRELAAAAEHFGATVAPIPYLGSAAVATAVLLSAARSAALETPAATATAFSAPAAPSTPSPTPASHAMPVSPAAELLRRMADGAVTAALAVEVTARPGTPFPAAARIAGSGSAGTTRLRGTIPAVADALPADVLLVPSHRDRERNRRLSRSRRSPD